MGADIYLRSVFEPNFEKHKPLFDEAVKLRDAVVPGLGESYQACGERQTSCQQKVEEIYELMYDAGYFRDPYNENSTLSLLGLSWWDDITPRLENGLLQPKDCKWLYDTLLNRLIGECTVHTAEMKLTQGIVSTLSGVKIEGTKVEVSAMPAEEIAWHQSKKTKLLQLLAQAIELNEPLLCSL